MNQRFNFDWAAYLKECSAIAAPLSAFRQSIEVPSNTFDIGMKLEARDPRNSTAMCIATVVDTLGPRIALRLDGTDDRNDFWRLVDSAEIAPLGTTPSINDEKSKQQPGLLLQPPFAFMKRERDWTRMYHAALQNEDNRAPTSCFKPQPLSPTRNQFSIGMKLEAVDRKNARLICVATIGDVRNDQVLVKFDGWRGTPDYWTRFDSRDLFPVGWCGKAGHPLELPGPGYTGPLSRSKPQQTLTAMKTNSGTAKSRPASNANSKRHQDSGLELSESSRASGRRLKVAVRGNTNGKKKTSETSVGSKWCGNKGNTQLLVSHDILHADNGSGKKRKSPQHDSAGSTRNSKCTTHHDVKKKSEKHGKRKLARSVRSDRCDVNVNQMLMKAELSAESVSKMDLHYDSKSVDTDTSTQVVPKSKSNSSSEVYLLTSATPADADSCGRVRQPTDSRSDASGESLHQSTTYSQNRIMIDGDSSAKPAVDSVHSVSSSTFEKAPQTQQQPLQTPSAPVSAVRRPSFSFSIDSLLKPSESTVPRNVAPTSWYPPCSGFAMPSFVAPSSVATAAATSFHAHAHSALRDLAQLAFNAHLQQPLPVVIGNGASQAPPMNVMNDEAKHACRQLSSDDSNSNSTSQSCGECRKLLITPLQQWSVNDVTHYLSHCDGSFSPDIDVFVRHDIDGEALALLTSELLVRHLGLKLGPAVKTMRLVDELKAKLKDCALPSPSPIVSADSKVERAVI